MKKGVTFFFILLLIIIGCTSIQKEIDIYKLKKGIIEGNTYSNKLYGFKITAPSDWTITQPTIVTTTLVHFVSPDKFSDFMVKVKSLEADTEEDTKTLLSNIAKEIAEAPTIKLISIGDLKHKEDIEYLEAEFKEISLDSKRYYLTARLIKGDNFVLILIGRTLTSYIVKTKDIFKQIFDSFEIDKLIWSAETPATKEEAQKPIQIEPTPLVEEETLKKEDIIHIVKWPGETLSHIALWYTGSITNWIYIADYNNIKSTVLHLGQKIKIPPELVKNSKPMDYEWFKEQLKKKEGKIEPETSTEKQQPSTEKTKEELIPIGPKR